MLEKNEPRAFKLLRELDAIKALTPRELPVGELPDKEAAALIKAWRRKIQDYDPMVLKTMR